MIQSPCTANWEAMTGDEQSRHCGQCNLNVYNLSAMTTQEAEVLLGQNSGGRLCVRYYQRPDGTVMTADCVAVRATHHRRARLIHKGVAASVLFLTLAGALTVQQAFAESSGPAMMGDVVTPAPAEPPPVIMGGIRPMPSEPTTTEKPPLKPCHTKKSKHGRHPKPPIVMGKMAAPH
jgi:hypothetical protein